MSRLSIEQERGYSEFLEEELLYNKSKLKDLEKSFYKEDFKRKKITNKLNKTINELNQTNENRLKRFTSKFNMLEDSIKLSKERLDSKSKALQMQAREIRSLKRSNRILKSEIDDLIKERLKLKKRS